jgi:hypothetical protein
MKIIYSVLALLLVIFACSKDDFETKPKISIKSVSPEFVPYNAPLRVRFEFRDKEGDVDDTLTMIRERLNINGSEVALPIEYDIPDFPDKNKGEFEVTIPFVFGLTLDMDPIDIPGNPNKDEEDTLRLKFVVRDKAKNISDTAVIDRVIVSRTPHTP